MRLLTEESSQMKLEIFLLILLPIFVKTSNTTTQFSVVTTTKITTTEMNSTTEKTVTENSKKQSKTGMITMMAIAPGIVISVMSGKMIYSRRQKKCLAQNCQAMQAAGNFQTADAAKGEILRMF